MIDYPAEVLAFLRDAAKLNEPSLGINVLGQAASAKYTELLRDIAVFDQLGLIALDDANDSATSPTALPRVWWSTFSTTTNPELSSRT